jgi:hypothetical protein
VFFTEAQVEDLWGGLHEAAEKLCSLRERFAFRHFNTPGAREHADHGFSRRLGSMLRCIENVYDILPPDRVNVPIGDETDDATINIQAFVMNAFGCCENLAWLWVIERKIRRPNGAELPQGWVGLGPDYGTVRGSFSQSFRDYLDTRRAWFEHLKDFRDALAHRIPLYIPPFLVDPTNEDHWNALGAEADEALLRGELHREMELREQQKSLAHFAPIMTHSLNTARRVIFHGQLLADFSTVHEIGCEFLAELDR